jgi:hypothetical protein
VSLVEHVVLSTTLCFPPTPHFHAILCLCVVLTVLSTLYPTFRNAGTIVPNGQLWAGNPAVYIRDVSEDEIAGFTKVL